MMRRTLLGHRRSGSALGQRARVATIIAMCATVLVITPTPTQAAPKVAPGYPGADADWRPANKSFFTTAYGLKTSTIWATGQDGTLSEVFYPDLSTPALREMDFAVLDNRGKAWKVSQTGTHSTTLDYPDAPVFTNTTTLAKKWRVTARFITDPSRTSLLAEITLTSLDQHAYQIIAIADPSLNNDGADDLALAGKGFAGAWEFDAAMTMKSKPSLVKTSIGFLGTSDAWSDVRRDGKLNWGYSSTDQLAGNIVLAGVLPLDGRKKTKATIALGFAQDLSAATKAADASLRVGVADTRKALAKGWQTYLQSLPKPPTSLTTPQARQTYRTSQMMLAASEDKTNPGAFIASPSSPWAWGKPGGGTTGYHSVWGRDSYQIATAMVAMGDKAAATRIAKHLLAVQSKSDGGAWQYTRVDGIPGASGVQLDQVAFPIVLAWQLGMPTASIWPDVQASADYLLTWSNSNAQFTSPATGQERWEEKPGYSPSTIAAEIAGLVCASDIARRQGESALAKSYLDTAKLWATSVKTWTLTTNGSLSDKPYFIRISRTGDPNAGTLLNTGNGGPTVDERTVVDAGFLELVRLGILSPNDPDVLNSLTVIDSAIAVKLGVHTYYYRYNHDGYGEDATGAAWSMNLGGKGRLWPLLSGERGEYNLLAGLSAAPQLDAMAAAANGTGLIAEQVWDVQPPATPAIAGKAAPRYQSGRSTMSATPLAWSHAQFIRLAWSIKSGAPVEMPNIVRCTFITDCNTG